MKPISEETHNSIVALLDNGLLSCKIAAQLGNNHVTVDRVHAKSRPEIAKSLGGQLAKLTVTDKHRLVHMVASGKADNAVQLTHALKEVTNVTLSTDSMLCFERGWNKGCNKEEKAMTYATTYPPAS